MSRTAFAAVIAALLATPVFSSSFSFAGYFSHDNDVQMFTFSLFSDATVTLQTLGYGGSADLPGGTNAAGQVITAGGFESVLQVYNAPSGVAVGGPIQPGPDPGCSPRTPDPGRFNFCQDAYTQIFLTAGDYLLSLTQSANDPLGNLSDGFFYVDSIPDPNFNSGFVGTLGLQGTNAWNLDILFVDTAEAPEPASALLAAAGLILAGIGARRRRFRAS
jgi:hypothetical protein